MGGEWSTTHPCRLTLGKDPVPVEYEAGWAPAPVWTGAENLAFTGIRSPDRPARSESLYRVSYPGPPKYLSASLHTEYSPEPHGSAVDTSCSVATRILKTRQQRR